MYDHAGGGYAFLRWTRVADDPFHMESLARKAAKEPLSSSPIERATAQILMDQIQHEEHNFPQIEILFPDEYEGPEGSNLITPRIISKLSHPQQDTCARSPPQRLFVTPRPRNTNQVFPWSVRGLVETANGENTQSRTVSQYPVGTCAMLPKELHGVVDGSVMPVLISGHIQTAVYGIAEREAEMIIKRWQ
ncbi:uncharacterized protein BDW43DRAFT_306687 [Aspergillus alliaceus]|uniref:uncharacterized protein n=1 Tax=Petromyces alliaceus TaxID=209559 RepID=UPI0012A5F901|nr:uncharacterized protein BDW43DRAFT_306687 [Aspergillus alliaceus]KAB8237980.1 hypothetical protein BDW43DRAFT_306687 [Aspergillus alliaceus]